MNRKRIQRGLLLLLFLLLTAGMGMPSWVQAAPSGQKDVKIEDLTFHDIKLYQNEKEQDLRFLFSYEKEDAKFYLIAPDHRVIDPAAEQADVTSRITKSGAREVIVTDAMSGQWMLRYRKGAKEGLSVTVEQYVPKLEITKFQIDSVEEGLVQYSFQTKAADHRWFAYSVYLGTGTKLDENARLLLSAEGYTGKTLHGSVRLPDAGENAYYLLLAVENEDPEKEPVVSHSERFLTEAVAAPEAYENFAVAADELTGELTVTWDWEELPWIEKLRITEKEDGELHVVRDFDRTVDSCVIRTAADRGESRLTVTIFDGTKEAVSTERVVKWEKTGSFQIVKDGGEQRKDDQWTYQYSNAKNQRLVQTVNGVSKTLQLNGDGEQTVTLNSDPCQISLHYVDAEGIEWVRERNVSRDTQAPEVVFAEDYSGYVTDASEVLLAGMTESTASVVLNGKTLPVGRDGSFQGMLSLQFGENSWKLEVTDTADNVSVFQGVVRMVSTSEYLAVTEQNELLRFVNEHAWECMALTAVVVLVIVFIWLFFFIKKWNRISRDAKERLAGNSNYADVKSIRRIRKASHAKMIANVFLGLWIINIILCMVGYLTAYYGSRLSQYSAKEQLLPELVSVFMEKTPTIDEIFEFLTWSVAFAGGLLLVTVLFQVIAGKLRKRADNSVYDAELKVKEQLTRKKEARARKKAEAKEKREKKKKAAAKEPEKLEEAAASKEIEVAKEPEKLDGLKTEKGNVEHNEDEI